MTFDEARAMLLHGGSMVDLLEAIGTVMTDPRCAVSDLILGLPHPEVVAEQASLALYRRTSRPLPDDRFQISTDPEDWIVWLLENMKSEPAERLRVLLAVSATTAARVKPQVAATLATAIDQAAE